MCLWGVFLFLCAGGVCLFRVYIQLLFGVQTLQSFVLFVVHVCVRYDGRPDCAGIF